MFPQSESRQRLNDSTTMVSLHEHLMNDQHQQQSHYPSCGSKPLNDEEATAETDPLDISNGHLSFSSHASIFDVSQHEQSPVARRRGLDDSLSVPGSYSPSTSSNMLHCYRPDDAATVEEGDLACLDLSIRGTSHGGRKLPQRRSPAPITEEDCDNSCDDSDRDMNAVLEAIRRLRTKRYSAHQTLSLQRQHSNHFLEDRVDTFSRNVEFLSSNLKFWN